MTFGIDITMETVKRCVAARVRGEAGMSGQSTGGIRAGTLFCMSLWCWTMSLTACPNP